MRWILLLSMLLGWAQQLSGQQLIVFEEGAALAVYTVFGLLHGVYTRKAF